MKTVYKYILLSWSDCIQWFSQQPSKNRHRLYQNSRLRTNKQNVHQVGSRSLKMASFKGLEKTFALTAGALTGLPIIAADAALKNDLSSNQLAGIKAVGALVAGYVTYKTHAILEQRNAEAIIKRTEELRTIATALSNLILHAKTVNVSIAGLIEGDVTTGQLLKNMSGSDALDLSIDFDIQIAYVLENIIKEARWLNQKLAILNHPTIDIRFIVAVYADLQRIYLSNHPEGGLDKKLKEYKQMLHDKK